MKNNVRNIFGAFMLLVIAGLTATGCVEHRYYHEHHQHSPEWSHRHHTDARLDVDIHN